MTTKTPFIVHCDKCKHEWAAFYLPMPISDAAAIASSLHCPMCATDGMRIFCGPARVGEINTSLERVNETGKN